MRSGGWRRGGWRGAAGSFWRGCVLAFGRCGRRLGLGCRGVWIGILALRRVGSLSSLLFFFLGGGWAVCAFSVVLVILVDDVVVLLM